MQEIEGQIEPSAPLSVSGIQVREGGREGERERERERERGIIITREREREVERERETGRQTLNTERKREEWVPSGFERR